MPRDLAGEKLSIVVDKLTDIQPERLAMKLPCAVGSCKEPAIHVVSGTFDYPEKVGSRWEIRTETFLLYLCRDHRNRWLRKNTEVRVGGGLI